MQALPQAFAALAAYRQFIVYRLEPIAGKPGKMNKIPINPYTRQTSNAHDPAIWLSADDAIAIVQAWGEPFGVGFVFTESDPFVFVDMDGCLVNGQWSELSVKLMGELSGAAVEISQSGQGLHIIGTAAAVPPHGCKNQALGLEFYHTGRFVALTGEGATGDASSDLTARLPALIDQYFPPAPDNPTVPAQWTSEPMGGYAGPTDDQELITRARGSGGNLTAAVFGGAPTKATLDDLWTANTDALSASYPDNYGNRPYDASSADAALAAHLAFWTGCNAVRMERLMRQSALVREKWDKHKTYLKMTILNAIGRCDTIYAGGGQQQQVEPPESVEPAAPVADDEQGEGEPEIVSGFQYLAADQQVEHFKGCVYVQDAHRVFTPRGSLLRPEQFKATYGGYVFVLDAANDKTTKNAWEAFVESQVVRYPMAEGLTFRPEMIPGKLTREEGRVMVNTYMPARIEMIEGDVAKFLDHLYRVLPDGQDAEILLAYMAACVQYIGVKFQWWPLIQGVEGNGKTLFTRCVAHAVGLCYSHFPRAESVGEKFNSWMFRKLFIGIEDVYYPDHRREIIENLKPLITNDELPIEPKGVDQVNAHICANGMLNSNHRDAIRKTRNDRRFCVFFSAQQSAADIQRDGMANDYFPDLYAWLRGDGQYTGQASGYAKVAHFLATYAIPDELNPATQCHRAPETSTTEQVIAHGMGSVEQEILEAIDEERPGFAGGWVSSQALDRLLEQIRMARAIPPNKRREVMQGLGYDYHPALNRGRVNNPVAPDGGKPRLYIRGDHPDRAVLSPAEVSARYQEAQAAAGERLSDHVFGPK